MVKLKKLRYNSTYGRLLENFMDGNNIRPNPHYRPGVKYSQKMQWFWHNVQHEETYKKISGNEYPFKPCIETLGINGHTMWLIGNMVKYGLIVCKTAGDGYDVTEHGKEFYVEYLEYLREIGVKLA